MARATQSELGHQFLALHDRRKTLLLPNAWDVASARIFEEAGFPAIGTSSAGVAFALGYPDGQKISSSEMLAVVHRIAEAVHIPVTADVEAGYGTKPEGIAKTAREVLAAGADVVVENDQDRVVGDRYQHGHLGHVGRNGPGASPAPTSSARMRWAMSTAPGVSP